MVQWWYVLILCDYVPSGLPGQTLIQLWLQLTNETCVAWLLLIMCLAFYMTAGWGLLRPLSVLLFVYFFNRNKRLKYAKTVHKIVHSSCSSEYDNNISHAKTLFLHWKCHINANLAFQFHWDLFWPPLSVGNMGIWCKAHCDWCISRSVQ